MTKFSRSRWLEVSQAAASSAGEQEEDLVYLVSILMNSVFAGLHGIKHIGMIIFILETHFRSSSKTNTQSPWISSYERSKIISNGK